MTEIEKQALKVARAWREFQLTDDRLRDDRIVQPARPQDERRRDLRALPGLYHAWRQEMETLAKMVL